MKNMEIVTQKVEQVVSFTCDCCKKEYNDILEMQEFLSWEDTCGYGNIVFGDLNLVKIDLCQYCVKKLLGDYIRVTEGNMYE